MRQLFFTIIVLFSLNIMAQDTRFTGYVYTEPFADQNTHQKDIQYGFTAGVGVEYQMELMYFGLDVFTFPGLNNVSYYDFTGTLLGFNFHNWKKTTRIYTGLLRGGVIMRNGSYIYPQVGSDIGFDYYFSNTNLYAGINGSLDYAADNKYWGEDGGHIRQNFQARIGLTF